MIKHKLTRALVFSLVLSMSIPMYAHASGSDWIYNGENTALDVKVTADVASSWTVEIPKSITLTSSSRGTGTYTGSVPVTVSGDIATNEIIVVDSDNSFNLSAGNETVQAVVNKQKTEFNFDDMKGGQEVTTSHTISAELTPEEWSGLLKFYINLEKDGNIIENSEAVIAYGSLETLGSDVVSIDNMDCYKAADFDKSIEDLYGKQLMMSIDDGAESAIAVGVDLTEELCNEYREGEGIYYFELLIIIEEENELGIDSGIYIPALALSAQSAEFIIYDKTKNVDSHEKIQLYFNADNKGEIIRPLGNDEIKLYKLSDKTFDTNEIIGSKATALAFNESQQASIGASTIIEDNNIVKEEENIYLIRDMFVMVTGNNSFNLDTGIYIASDVIDTQGITEGFLTRPDTIQDENIIFNWKLSDGYKTTDIEYNGLKLVQISPKAFAPSMLNEQIMHVEITSANESVKSFDKYIVINEAEVEEVEEGIYTCDSFIFVHSGNSYSLNPGIYIYEAFASLSNSAELTLYRNNNNIYYYEDEILFDSEDKEKLLYYTDTKTETMFRIPNTVKIIGDEAFKDCNNLIDVEFNDGLTEINTNAFYNCKNITAITLPSTLKTVGTSAFTNCKNVTSLELNDGLEYIGGSAFNYMGEIGTVRIPGTVKDMGEFIFHCTNITTAIIEEGVTTIPHSMFYNYGILETVYLPSTIENIEEHAFYCWKPNGDRVGGTINYAGTEDQWGNITKHQYYDEPAVINFGVAVPTE